MNSKTKRLKIVARLMNIIDISNKKLLKPKPNKRKVLSKIKRSQNIKLRKELKTKSEEKYI